MLLAATRRFLDDQSCEQLAPFLAEWPAISSSRDTPPSSLPVLRHLPATAGHTIFSTADLAATLRQHSDACAWRQTYAAADLPPEFLDNYGWTELIGQRGPTASDRIACGFLLLGPATHYPSHRHAAEEIYVPLAGTAAWQRGDANWQDQPPGTRIHHPSWMLHAMRTHATPLLALYLWRGGDLAQKSVFTGN